MPKTARVLNVFLASPDDVKEERAAAEKIVDDLNKIIRTRLGWTVWLYRWEDATPGFGRPQEIINAAVDSCDLFIGLLWKRWGQPSGKYSSGFEEEYDRARARRRESETPEIWLVFKSVDEDSLKDPGPQLSKVLEFRMLQSNLGDGLYQKVADIDDWKRSLTNWIYDHILKLYSQSVEITQPPASLPTQPPAVSQPVESSAGRSQEKRLPEQVSKTAESLAVVASSRDLDSFQEGMNTLSEFEITRLHLLSSTWMFREYTGDTLGTHEMNLLYKYRESLETTPPEEVQLFRALVSDDSDVIPGWFWFKDMATEKLIQWLLSTSSGDSSPSVRQRTIRLLRTSHVELPKEYLSTLPVLDEAESVRLEAYAYLGEIGDEEMAKSLEEASSTEPDVISLHAAAQARLSILLRLRPTEAFLELAKSGEYVSEERLRQLEEIATNVADDALLECLKSDWEPLRRIAATKLAERSKLTVELALRIGQDPSSSIRHIAFTELARKGHALDLEAVRKSLSAGEDDVSTGRLVALKSLWRGAPASAVNPDTVILEFFKGKTSDVVAQFVDWFSIDGRLAYKSLAIDHYDAIGDEIRGDLNNGFVRIRQNSVATIEARFDSNFAQKMSDGFKNLDGFIRSQFTEAALSGIAIHGKAEDAHFGRQHLRSDTTAIRHAAVRILAAYGAAKDVPDLIEIARHSYGEVQEEAGLAALRLSDEPLNIALELAKSSNEKLASAGLIWLDDHQSLETTGFFLDALESEAASQRERAIYYFLNTMKREEFISLLESQFGKSKYYYNVVTWVDRLLYAPEAVRPSFVSRLKRNARA